MNAKTRKNLILSLIRDDMVNTKLVNALNDLGLQAEPYYLHLSTTIFRLLGIRDNIKNEAIYERYMMLCEKAKEIDISESHNGLDKLVEEVYQILEYK